MRACSNCGRWYHRRNRIGCWTTRSPGKRLGWTFEEVKICMACMNVKNSERVLFLASVRMVPKVEVQPKKRGRKKKNAAA